MNKERDTTTLPKKAAASGTRAPVPLIFGMVLLAFVGGGILVGWLLTRYDLFDSGVVREPPARLSDASAPPQAGPSAQPTGAAATADAPPATVDAPALVEQSVAMTAATTLRMAELQGELDRMEAEAADAGRVTARAETLLALAAARRALDQGLPLGPAGDALARRFAAADPALWRQLDAAARTPVTREELLTGLADMRGELVRPEDVASGWQAFTRGLSELFVLRRAGSPAQNAAARLDRAERLVITGNLRAAIAEVEALPGAARAGAWLADARRFAAGRAALDRMESRVLADAQTPAAPPSAAPPSAFGPPPVSGAVPAP